ncbi:MAG: hypothetical protein AVDCRST_MAG28-4194, partial [uncultured Rubrobacteraceae bacterium]
GKGNRACPCGLRSRICGVWQGLQVASGEGRGRVRVWREGGP